MWPGSTMRSARPSASTGVRQAAGGLCGGRQLRANGAAPPDRGPAHPAVGPDAGRHGLRRRRAGRRGRLDTPHDAASRGRRCASKRWPSRARPSTTSKPRAATGPSPSSPSPTRRCANWRRRGGQAAAVTRLARWEGDVVDVDRRTLVVGHETRRGRRLRWLRRGRGSGSSTARTAPRAGSGACQTGRCVARVDDLQAAELEGRGRAGRQVAGEARAEHQPAPQPVASPDSRYSWPGWRTFLGAEDLAAARQVPVVEPPPAP